MNEGAYLDQTASVWYCILCGPILRLRCSDGVVTYHDNVEHPALMDFHEGWDD